MTGFWENVQKPEFYVFHLIQLHPVQTDHWQITTWLWCLDWDPIWNLPEVNWVSTFESSHNLLPPVSGSSCISELLCWKLSEVITRSAPTVTSSCALVDEKAPLANAKAATTSFPQTSAGSLIPTLKRENLWRKPEMDFAQLYSRSIDEMIIDQRILNRIQQEMDFYVLPHFPTTPHLLRYP